MLSDIDNRQIIVYTNNNDSYYYFGGNMERFSRKRKAVIDCLKSTDTHPTAEWIYSQLKPSFPDLSQATVYRNLGRLCAEGAIRSVGVVNGQERYDGNTEEHSHAVCVVCGKVIDVFAVSLPEGLTEKVENETGFSIKMAELRFSGICAECEIKLTEK